MCSLRERIHFVGRGHVPAGAGTSERTRRGRRPRRPACRNGQLRTNLFVCTVCRCAVGTPGGLRSRWRRRSLTDAAYPLRVRALRITYRTLAVGRDDSARRCRNYQIRKNPLVCTQKRTPPETGGVQNRFSNREAAAKSLADRRSRFVQSFLS